MPSPFKRALFWPDNAICNKKRNPKRKNSIGRHLCDMAKVSSKEGIGKVKKIEEKKDRACAMLRERV